MRWGPLIPFWYSWDRNAMAWIVLPKPWEKEREWKEGGDVQTPSDLKHSDIKARSRWWLDKEIYWHSLGSNTSCIKTAELQTDLKRVAASARQIISRISWCHWAKTSYLATPICIFYVYIWAWPICKLIIHFTCLHGDTVLKIFSKEYFKGVRGAFGSLLVFDCLASNQHLSNVGSELCHSSQVVLPFRQQGCRSVCAHAEAGATLDQSADRV